MVRKAVIPAAGFGTRFLPATKSQPKEMLPIVDTPTIYHVVEEAVAAGIDDILMVIGKNKRAIEEFFDRNFELEAELAAQGKTDELERIRRISDMANVHFIWQNQMRGLGDAVLHGKCHVGNEPFAVLLGDTIFDAQRPVLSQLLEVFEHYREPVVAVEQVGRDKVSRYGVIQGKPVRNGTYLIDDFVEKPAPEDAPSDMVIAGRYVFTPEIFDYLERVTPGRNSEIQLTDAMCMMVRERAMYGRKIDGRRLDIGNKLDYIKTNILYGLRSPDIGDDLKAYVKEIAANL